MRKDFLQDENGDLVIKNGDFVIVDSNEQHVADIIDSNSNDYKEYPYIGLNLASYLSTNIDKNQLNTNIKNQLALDGYDDMKSVEKLTNYVLNILLSNE
jgi:hypothetical protein